jgi:hypothetical protein
VEHHSRGHLDSYKLHVGRETGPEAEQGVPVVVAWREKSTKAGRAQREESTAQANNGRAIADRPRGPTQMLDQVRRLLLLMR